MKKTQERRKKKYRPSTTTLSGIKTTWGRALMIDYSFMSVDPYKNPVKFKYNRKIRDVIISAEKEGREIPRHEFSKTCSEMMFKCEAESDNKNKKESRFDINIIAMAVLSSKIDSYPVKNPDGKAYHTSIASVINISTLSIREIDFLKIAFAGHIDYEIGTISAEVLYSEKDPNEKIVRKYVDASPIIMINHIKDIIKSQEGGVELSEQVEKEIAEYSASLNVNNDLLHVEKLGEGKIEGEDVDKNTVVSSRLFGDNAYALIMTCLFCFLLSRVFYYADIAFGVREAFATAAILLGTHIVRKGVLSRRNK